MTPPPDLSRLTEAEKDALILALWARVAELEARLDAPPKTPGNSSLPPSKGHKANRPERTRQPGPRRGSLGREGGGRSLAEEPDQRVVAKAAACAHCRAALGEADQRLHARYDKVELPPVRPVVTRVERYRGRCPRCGGTTLAPVPEGLEEGSPFGPSVLAQALYLRFTHAISYRRLTRLFLHLFALPISEGALDALFRRAKPRFDDEAAAILARLRRARVVCSGETTVRVDGRTHWNWVFRNDEVVVHVIRPTRGRAVVTELLGGRRPDIWVSDLHGAQRGHADLWQVCLAHQLRDLRYAVEAGDTVFAPRLKALLRAQGRHPTGIPPPSRTGAGPGPGAAAEPPPRPAAAPALPRGARQPVHLPRAPGGAAGQQRQRARPAADGGVPRGHRRVPLGLGAGPVRRGRVGGRHRRPARDRRLPRHPCRPIRQDRPPPRVSSYSPVTPGEEE